MVSLLQWEQNMFCLQGMNKILTQDFLLKIVQDKKKCYGS